MKRRCIFLMLLSIVTLTTCYKEDFSDCSIFLHVHLQSVMQKYAYEDIVEQLDLYLYDKNRALVSQYTYDAEELTNMDFIPVIPIELPGDYTLTVLVNSHNSYTVEGIESLTGFKVSLNADTDDIVRKRQDDLYYAMKEITISASTSNRHLHETLDLYKNTNHINVDVSFRRERPGAYPLIARMESNNGSFDYTNTCHSQSKRIYMPYAKNDTQAKIVYNFTTMQIWLTSDLVLYLEEDEPSGKVLKTQLNLTEEITKVYNTEEKLNQEDTFNILLVLESDYVIFELKINDWYVIYSGEEI